MLTLTIQPLSASDVLIFPEEWLLHTKQYVIKPGLIQRKKLDYFNKNGENPYIPEWAGNTGNGQPFRLRIQRAKPNNTYKPVFGDHLRIQVHYHPALSDPMTFYVSTEAFKKQLSSLRNKKGNSLLALRAYDVYTNILFIEIDRQKARFRFVVVKTSPIDNKGKLATPPSSADLSGDALKKAKLEWELQKAKELLKYLPKPEHEVVWTKWTHL